MRCLRAGLLFAVLSLLSVGITTRAAKSPAYWDIKEQAEKLFTEGNFAGANKLYNQAAAANPPAEEADWVEFRLVDTRWRAEREKDLTSWRSSRTEGESLRTLAASLETKGDRGRTRAEVEESLGDLILGKETWGWSEAYDHYAKALDYWASSRDLDTARARYLGIVFRFCEPPGASGNRNPYLFYKVPDSVLEDAISIASSQEDRSHAQSLLALRMKDQSSCRGTTRARECFEAVLAGPKDFPWYDDTLFLYGEWLSKYGVDHGGEGDHCSRGPDWPAALRVFERIAAEYDPKNSPYPVLATQKIREITRTALSLSVDSIFLPGSEVSYTVAWRNNQSIAMALYPLEDSGADFPERVLRILTKGAGVPMPTRPAMETWTVKAGAPEDHSPGQEVRRLTKPLQAGTYILEARTESNAAYQLILVTDLALIVQEVAGKALVYAFDVRDGAPVPGAGIRLQKTGDKATWGRELVADHQGFATADLPRVEGYDSGEMFAAARSGDRVAVARGGWHRRGASRGAWHCYAFTDRPAYRPGEQVHWKVIARTWEGGDYSTPAGRTLLFRLEGPKGEEVASGQMALNGFGAAWGDFDLPQGLALGEFSLALREEGRDKDLAREALFRVEEYKLPEFKVSVKAGSVGGHPGVYRPGDRVPVEIAAEYYFGGPVSGATVDLVVRKRPFTHRFPEEPDFPWMTDNRAWYGYLGEGEEIRRETLRTGPGGGLMYWFEVPEALEDETEFEVEARVSESSRREVTETGSFKVTRAPYYVEIKAGRALVKPGETVEVKIRALDANDLPVRVRGTLRLVRETWKADDGVTNRGTGKALGASPARGNPRHMGGGTEENASPGSGSFHPEEVLTTEAGTGEDGRASMKIIPPRDGYYRLIWDGTGVDGEPEVSEGVLWVADQRTRDLGRGAVRITIICDKESYRAGDQARILLLGPGKGRRILFTADSGEHSEHWIFPMLGPAQFIEVPVLAEHRPNINFGATVLGKLEALHVGENVRVPFAERFLRVEVLPAKSSFLPREEATFSVRVSDASGAPVEAEVALSVTDDSIRAIGEDEEEDIREAFYPSQHYFYTSAPVTSFSLKPYATLEPEPPKLDGPGSSGRLGSWSGRGGHLKGTVVDDAGQAIPGALVVATSSTLEGFRGVATNLDGEYEMLNLPPNSDYSIKVEASGYNTVVRKMVRVQAGLVTTLPFMISQGATSVNVCASPPVVSMKNTAVSTTLSEGDILAIPLDRNYANILYLAPSASGSRTISGGQAVENAFLLNGVDVTRSAEHRLVVRNDFRTTASWAPDLRTGPDGTATVAVILPDNLTTWRALAHAQTAGSDFGKGEASVTSDQPILVRLQAPRFLVAGDQAVISAVVNNRTDKPEDTSVIIVAEGVDMIAEDGSAGVVQPEPISLTVAPFGQMRADWRVSSPKAGLARFIVAARGVDRGDAMERTIPIYEHGIDKQVFRSGKLQGREAHINLSLPEERKKSSTSMHVEVTPSLAGSLVGALPYLVDFPYGCTEQTMSRFLPAVIVAKTLKDLGIPPEGAAEIAMSANHPPRPPAAKKGEGGLSILGEATKRGLLRLYGTQSYDGGWGWWPSRDSDPFMTAYVVWGLTLARQAGVEVKADVLEEGETFLEGVLGKAELRLSTRVWVLQALTESIRTARGTGGGPETAKDIRWPKTVETEWGSLWEKRDAMSAASKALLALTSVRMDHLAESRTLVSEIEKDATEDGPHVASGIRPEANMGTGETRTVRWGAGGAYRYWLDGPVGSTAFSLMALLAIEPDHRLVDPAVAWLVNNRRGNHWNSTLDTAMAILGLSTFLKGSGELGSEAEVEVLVNGRSVATKSLGGTGVACTPVRIEVPTEHLLDGSNTIAIRRTKGDGAIYYAALASFFSEEEPVGPSGNGMQSRREYFRLKSVPTLLKGFIYDKVPIGDGDKVTSGERIEVVLTVEVKDDLEYVVIEDLKPAGFEAVQLTSGEDLSARELTAEEVERRFGKGSQGRPSTGKAQAHQPTADPRKEYTEGSRSVYQELRDRKVSLFLDELPAGVWEIRYDLRAEVPGLFHGLPVIGQAMYAPEIRCNGEEVRVKVTP